MPKKKPEKARTTPAAPNAPAPTPAFLAERPTSALASSTSARTSVDRSDMALWTRVPTDGSSVPAAWMAGDVLDALETLWATGGSFFDGGAGQGNGAVRRRAARPRVPRTDRRVVRPSPHSWP